MKDRQCPGSEFLYRFELNFGKLTSHNEVSSLEKTV